MPKFQHLLKKVYEQGELARLVIDEVGLAILQGARRST